MSGQDVIKQFDSYPVEMKALALYYYLTHSKNMEEAAEKVVEEGLEVHKKNWSGFFSSTQPNRVISNIMSRYGFDGRNARIFSRITTYQNESIEPGYEAYLAYVKDNPKPYNDKRFDGENSGQPILEQFLIDYYSEAKSKGQEPKKTGKVEDDSKQLPDLNLDSELLDKYGKWGCLALLVIPLAMTFLGNILRSPSAWLMLLAIGGFAYYSANNTSGKVNVRKPATQGRMKVVVFIERFVMLFWIIGSCGPMLIDGFPLLEVLMVMFLIILVISLIGRGVEKILKQIF